jgi:2-keto-3-deoxy-L-rhamnonate aldolase RhmA
MPTNLRKRLQSGKLALGTILSLNSPDVAEVLSKTGFDWLFIDGEHGTFDTRELQAILQAAGENIECVFRIPALDEVHIKKALDVGSNGLIVPQVNTAEQAQNLVKWSRYPPEGARGLGFARAQGYGFEVNEYLQSANETITLIVQAESAEAVKNIEAIVQVGGLDAVLVGPYDLSSSLGRPGEVTHPQVQEAIKRVASVCKEAKMPVGIFGMTAQAVQPYIEQGFRLIVVGVDTVLLGNATRQLLQQLKEG